MSPRRTRVARTSRPRPARRAMLLTRRAKANAARPRRGVLLLVVLSLLVLFLMVGTAFVITAKQSEKAAKSSMKASVRIASEAAQADLLDEVLRQIVRDTNNPHSSLRFHSLLGDMYGNDGLKGVITSTLYSGNPPSPTPTPPKFAGLTNTQTGPGPTAAQMIDIHIGTMGTSNNTLQLRDLYGNIVDAKGNSLEFARFDNAYNGQVLTFLNGPAKGRSTRIVGFIPPNTFRVMNPRLENGAQLVENDLPNLDGNRVLINGRAFSGMGVGLNPMANTGDARLTALEKMFDPDGNDLFPEVSLLPNARFFTSDPTNNVVRAPKTAPNPLGLGYFPFNSLDWTGRGGANESYDAADFQNMALAMAPATQLVETYLNAADLANSGVTLPNRLDDPTGIFPVSNSTPTSMVIPSWHRPELLNYWGNHPQLDDPSPANPSNPDLRKATLAGYAPMLRKILLRPNWLDHPNFTGSNPEFAAIPNTDDQVEYGQKLARMVHGPWDVDNDNDGVRDSVWIDVGLPVMAGPNGKLVKPLVAMYILDMDGRLNVNAHGSCDLADAWGTETGLQSLATVAAETKALAGSGTTNATPRGVGMGPADISLAFASGNKFRDLLRGETFTINGNNVFYPGRYGHPDNSGMIRPGFGNQVDLMSLVGMNGWTQRSTAPSIFAGSTPDMRARYGVGVNDFGLPVFDATLNANVMNSASDDLAVDSPYELNLSQTTAIGSYHTSATQMAGDAPFTVAELERVLRVYDSDAGVLPKRLAYLSGVLRPNSIGQDEAGSQFFSRNELTTDSYDLPIPDVSIPVFLQRLVSQDAAYRRMPKSAAEILEMRVRQALFPVKFMANGTIDSTTPPQNIARQFPNPLTDAADIRLVRGHMRQLLSPDLANGTRLNVNRAFGNGRDDNNNGVVDEPGEYYDADGNGAYDPGRTGPQAEETLVWPFGTSSSGSPIADAQYSAARFPMKATEIVPDPDFTKYPNGRISEIDHRQLMARHLYVTALMLTTDAQYGLGTDPKADQILARRVAQWAVNVIDFRDPDNIMTAFEYDVNPFDGWDTNIDGIPNETYADTSMVQMVWGAERPELLITETAAWHDRRTDNTVAEDPYPPSDNASQLDPDPLQPKEDKDFDQAVRPRGALFIELYNPWPGSPGVSADTHAVGSATTPQGNLDRVDRGVDLTKRAYDGSPAWRLAMYKRGKVDDVVASAWDPDSPDPAKRPNVPIDRTVFFTGQQAPTRYPTTGAYSIGTQFFNRSTNPVPPVRPGRYLVVGSGEESSSGSGVYQSPIGDIQGYRNPDSPNFNKKRRIELAVANVANKVRVVDSDVGNTVLKDSTIPAGSTYALESPAEPGPGSTLGLAVPGDTSLCITDVAVIDQALNPGQTTPEKRRLTISEPAIGYPGSWANSKWDTKVHALESHWVYQPPLDMPLDGPIGGQAQLDDRNAEWPYDYDLDPVLTQIRSPSKAGGSKDIQDLGASYSHIYLQRLANPLLAWNPPQGAPDHNANLPVNPYLTVDTATTNLTVFNSRGDSSTGGSGGTGEEEDGTPADDARDRFSSHERGYSAEVDPNSGRYISVNTVMPSLWGEEPASSVKLINANQNPSRKMALRPTTQNKFSINTLDPETQQQLPRMRVANEGKYFFTGVPFTTLGFANRVFQDQTLVGEQRKLQPQKPFEWANWNNRPFTSGNEVMFVPRTRSSEMMRLYSSADVIGTAPAPPEPYLKPTGEIDPANGRPKNDPQPAFGHLENFFYSDTTSTVRTVPREMHRVLDFLQTPSLFAGTDTWLNPTLVPDPTGVVASGIGFGLSLPAGQALQDLRNGTPADIQQLANYSIDPRLEFRAPFNTVSEFRDPGRINLNTLSVHPPRGGTPTPPTSEVWRGLFHGSTEITASPPSPLPNVHLKMPIEDFMKSRRGDDGASPLSLNKDLPTFLGNPFRAGDAADAVPLSTMRRNAIQAGLLRTSEPNDIDPKPDSKPLFSNEYTQPTDEYRDTKRNPYFRYQPISRLDNLTTTRSNVYAVWITIGFFEVEEVPDWNDLTNTQREVNFSNDVNLYRRVYPEGYTFGREDGVDVGNTRRLRGFYIIDRTQMAGFEPGADHNVENTVRLRRRIE